MDKIRCLFQVLQMLDVSQQNIKKNLHNFLKVVLSNQQTSSSKRSCSINTYCDIVNNDDNNDNEIKLCWCPSNYKHINKYYNAIFINNNGNGKIICIHDKNLQKLTSKRKKVVLSIRYQPKENKKRNDISVESTIIQLNNETVTKCHY